MNKWDKFYLFTYVFIHDLGVADSTTSMVCPALNVMPDWKQDNQMLQGLNQNSLLLPCSLYFYPNLWVTIY